MSGSLGYASGNVSAHYDRHEAIQEPVALWHYGSSRAKRAGGGGRVAGLASWPTTRCYVN
jgi:hypothetical protein